MSAGDRAGPARFTQVLSGLCVCVVFLLCFLKFFMLSFFSLNLFYLGRVGCRTRVPCGGRAS